MKPFWNKILPDFVLNLISNVHPDPLKCEVIPKVYVKRMEIDAGTSVIVDIEEENDDNFSFEVKEADITRFEKIIEKYN